MWIILGVVLGQLLATLAGFLALRWYVDGQRRALMAKVHDLTAADGEHPSQLAQFIDLAGETVGRAAARSIMQQIGTANSHAAKAANGMMAEVQPQNPLMAMLGGAKRGKGAGIMQLAQILGPMLSGGTPSNGNSSGESVADRYKL